MAKRPVKKAKPTVKAVVLPKAGVVQVAVPAKRKRTWWQVLFGN